MGKIIVIGGGPAGMMAAITASEAGNQVVLLEKNEKLGKKLFITGKGRCNITNACDPEDFFANVITNGKFLYSAFYGYDNRAVIDFFEETGCKVKEERGNRIFPCSDRSSDVLGALKRRLERSGVEVRLQTKVREIATKTLTNGITVVTGAVLADGKKIAADQVIVATGGVSYPLTGSTGDGYRFARDTGHTVTSVFPSLVPFNIEENWCKTMQGLSLKNVTVVIESSDKQASKAAGKILYKGFGEMLFTHFGVSGPLILSASSYYVSYHNRINRSNSIIGNNKGESSHNGSSHKSSNYNSSDHNGGNHNDSDYDNNINDDSNNRNNGIDNSISNTNNSNSANNSNNISNSNNTNNSNNTTNNNNYTDNITNSSYNNTTNNPKPWPPVKLSIDLKPALTAEQLDKRLLREIEANKNKQFKNILTSLLPSKMHPVIILLSDIPAEKKVNEITREERQKIIALLKNLPLTVTGVRDFDEAIITRGGVSVKEVNPSTMESKKVKGMYFAGEILDTDALTGGFNLQIAWSTGHLAGSSIKDR